MYIYVQKEKFEFFANTVKHVKKYEPYEWAYFLGITQLETGAPFTSWDSFKSLSILFIATSKSPDETLKEGRRWLDLVC